MGSIPSFHMCEQRLSSAVLIKEHPFTLHVLLFFVEDYFIKMCRYMLALHYVVIFQPLCFSHVFPLFQLDSFIIQCILTKIYPSSTPPSSPPHTLPSGPIPFLSLIRKRTAFKEIKVKHDKNIHNKIKNKDH